MTAHEYKILNQAFDKLKVDMINTFDKQIALLKGKEYKPLESECWNCLKVNCQCDNAYENSIS